VIIIPAYKFYCDSCQEDRIVNKKMSEYNPEETCDVCGSIMNRKIDDLVADYVCKTSGFYGKSSK
jgi:predicted nucleic acid-binding Zn ribbon protein